MIKPTTVDAILDTVSDDENPAHALADLIDETGNWDTVDAILDTVSDDENPDWSDGVRLLRAILIGCEVERLRAEVERLRAEVERLRDARAVNHNIHN
jgi:hypothetical protein